MSDVFKPSDFELTIDNDARRYLQDSARWSRFIGVAGIIIALFMISAGIYNSMNEAKTTDLLLTEEQRQARKAGVIAGCLILGFLFFFPGVMMMRHAAKMKTALESNNSEGLAQAFRI